MFDMQDAQKFGEFSISMIVNLRNLFVPLIFILIRKPPFL